jgi:hypothetical protein
MQVIHGTDVYTGYGSVLPLDLQGWNSSHPVFNEIISKDRSPVILDVGVWKSDTKIRSRFSKLSMLSRTSPESR